MRKQFRTDRSIQSKLGRPELFGGQGQNTLLGGYGGLFHSLKFPFGGPLKLGSRGKLPPLPPLWAALSLSKVVYKYQLTENLHMWSKQDLNSLHSLHDHGKNSRVFATGRKAKNIINLMPPVHSHYEFIAF
jgi:hypothetical protein